MGGPSQTRLASIYGINMNHEVIGLTVIKKGRSVIFSLPGHTCPIHPSNADSPDGWIREAVLAFDLTNVVEVSEVLGTARCVEVAKELHLKAEKLKAADLQKKKSDGL